MIKVVRNVFLLIAVFVVIAGCRSSHCYNAKQFDLKLPEWFTMPRGDAQTDTPVSLGICLPEHLQKLTKEYGLPGWVVYGVVRSLGAREFLANGVIKTFTVTDEYGESSVVVDEIYYDVADVKIRLILASIASACADAKNELDRKNILGGFVVKRFGSIVLFSLDHAGECDGNLLMTTGESSDAMEQFDETHSAELPVVGWKETSTHYITTMPGTFMYGNPVLAFRRTEEEAIRDLAKTLLHKFSHMRKSVVDDASDQVDDEIKEDVFREEITLRMRGVRVLRRAVDVKNGLCLVEVSVPRNGVARQ